MRRRTHRLKGGKRNMRKAQHAVVVGCVVLFSACDREVGSVGVDECFGVTRGCEQTEASRLEWEGLTTVSSRGLSTLSSARTRVLDVPERDAAHNKFGKVTAGINGELWLHRATDDRRSLELVAFDRNGALLDTRTLPMPSLPTRTELAVYEADESQLLVWEAIPVASARGKALSVAWHLPCHNLVDPTQTSCAFFQLLVFDEDTGEVTLNRTYAGAESMPIVAADGAVWTVAPSIRKRDEEGQLLVQQTVLLDAPFEQELAGTLDAPRGVAFPDGSIGLNTATSVGQELWRFDTRGDVIFRGSLAGEHAQLASSIVDSVGHWTLVWTSEMGDLHFERVHDGENRMERYLVPREEYTHMHVLSLARDDADNIYALTTSGGYGEATPTLCRLAMAGDLGCVLVPELTADHIVGGEPGVVYTLASSLDARAQAQRGADEPAPPAELKLLRFEFPK